MRRRGFTLVELMVVVAIIVLLATILLPTANHAYAVAKRTMLQADLQVVANAIDAYQHDWGDIPRPDRAVKTPWQGAGILSWALIAPGPAVTTTANGATIQGDGADGPGFRIRGSAGTVIGPYLPVERFTLGTTLTAAPAGDARPLTYVLPPVARIFDNQWTVLGDRNGNVILYFPRKLKATISDVNTYFGGLSSTPAYVANDNDPGLAVVTVDASGNVIPPHSVGRDGSGNPWALHQFQLQLPGVVADSNGNPTLPDPSQAIGLPYLLWDAGPDGRFCTDDDVTNFKR